MNKYATHEFVLCPRYIVSYMLFLPTSLSFTVILVFFSFILSFFSFSRSHSILYSSSNPISRGLFFSVGGYFSVHPAICEIRYWSATPGKWPRHVRRNFIP